MNDFTVIKETGRPLLGRKTIEKLKVLCVGPENVPNICYIAEEGCDHSGELCRHTHYGWRAKGLPP